MLELNKIYCMDNILGMKKIEDNSIDLVITSPPYDKIRDYSGFLLDLHNVGVEISRILKDGGICVMVIQDGTEDGRKSGTSFRTIIDWDTNTDLDLFETCIYYRSGTPGAWWSKRFRVDHEFIPIFIKGKRPQYFNKDHMKEETKPEFGKVKKGLGNRNTDGSTIYDKSKTYYLPDMKDQGTVIHYKNSSRETPKSSEIGKIKLQHPATFPDKLAEDFIKCFTTEGMTVLDPFMGSGTVAAMAKLNNRNFIGFDTSQDYCDIADKRLEITP
jgi:site-specific DNA-methyltransferase (adenine-specific)